MSDQAAFYQFLRQKDRTVVLSIDTQSGLHLVYGKVTWTDPYAIGFSPSKHQITESWKILGMEIGQTTLVMKKSIVAVTPLTMKEGAHARGNAG